MIRKLAIAALTSSLFLSPLTVGAQTPSVTIPSDPVRPSLWWSVERFGHGLVESLAIDAKAKVVKINVDSSVWVAADYIRRYAFLQKLGSLAIDDNYGVLIQDERKRKLAEFAIVGGKVTVLPPNLGASPFRPDLNDPFSRFRQ